MKIKPKTINKFLEEAKRNKKFKGKWKNGYRTMQDTKEKPKIIF